MPVSEHSKRDFLQKAVMEDGESVLRNHLLQSINVILVKKGKAFTLKYSVFFQHIIFAFWCLHRYIHNSYY